MKYRRKYTLFTLKNRKGKPVWYFRIYLPDGTRRSKTTGCNSKEKAMQYVDELLDDETMLRKVFESNLIVAIDSSHSLIQANIQPAAKDSITSKSSHPRGGIGIHAHMSLPEERQELNPIQRSSRVM